MAKMYYAEDANKDMLQGKKITVIGYGSQGHAHSLNLKDSGADVTVGLYEGSKSKERAKEAGLNVMNTGEAVKQADIVMILVNDEIQAKLYKEEIEPLPLPTGLISISARLCRLRMWTLSWLRLRRRGIP